MFKGPNKYSQISFFAIVESVPNAIIIVDGEGVINLVNSQTEKLFGYDRTELVSEKIEVLIPQRFKENHPGHRDSFFNSPSVRAMGAGRTLFAIKKNKSEIPVEIGLNPIRAEDGELMTLVSIIDISERKGKELVIQQQVEELELKNKELEQFAYLASHDLQQPLRTISNFIQIVNEDYGDSLDEEGKGHLNVIDKAAKRMMDLVRSVLDYSRLGRSLGKESLDLQSVVKDTISDLDILIKEHNAKVNIIGNLPQLKGYKSELGQLFQNIILNAIKYSKEDVSPEIQISYEENDNSWHFSISDNGIGIEQKYFDRIFNIFQQINRSDKAKGLGIGLANCKKIVELHEGNLWVESEFGKGSVFHFTLKK